MKCPQHDRVMVSQATTYGMRYACPADGCTVVCWDGSTLTPADAETRTLRHQCHELFDPLWKTRKRFRTRLNAYIWLANAMGSPIEKAHIGMFDADQCRKLLGLLKGET